MSHLISDLNILTDEMPTEIAPKKGAFSGRKLFIENYGCQMNFSDGEIVTSILSTEGFTITDTEQNADLILLNSCSIREKAEQTIRHRLETLEHIKRRNPDLLVGVLGCMAERLKTKLLDEEKLVDIVAGPDAYRDLPRLVQQADKGEMSVNTFLSREETYHDIEPVRLNSNGVTAFISIMRGCDNMCSFCVVPYTRGRERSRDPQSIKRELETLEKNGYKEVTLLGQNVDSYKWNAENKLVNFAGLLDFLATDFPSIRFRFSTSHPKDMTDEVLHVMAKHENICKYIHLPVQSGNTAILSAMNRGYTREDYLNRIKAIRQILGTECGLSTDIIVGFCGETEEAHQDTLSLMDDVKFDYSFMFNYSERPGTPAAKKLKDDVSAEDKRRRLDDVIFKQNAHSLQSNQQDIGKIVSVLIEGDSRRSSAQWQGRNSQNKVVVFPKENFQKGQIVSVRVESCTGGTLIGTAVHS